MTVVRFASGSRPFAGGDAGTGAGSGSGSGDVAAGGVVAVSARGEVVDGGVVDVVVDVTPCDVVLDDPDDVRASSDGAPAPHAVPIRARLVIRPQSLSTRRCYVGDAWRQLAALLD